MKRQKERVRKENAKEEAQLAQGEAEPSGSGTAAAPTYSEAAGTSSSLGIPTGPQPGGQSGLSGGPNGGQVRLVDCTNAKICKAQASPHPSKV